MSEAERERQARQARLAQARESTKKAEAEAVSARAKAESDARIAEANAKAASSRADAEAETAKVKAQSELRAAESAMAMARLNAESAAREAEERRVAIEAATKSAEKQRAADSIREGQERTYQLGINAGAAVLGMAVGHAGAHVIKASHAKHVAATAPAVAALAKAVKPLLSQAVKSTEAGKLARDKLAGVVTTAAKMKIGRVAGPVGLVTAGLFLLDGAFSRFVLAPQIESKTGKEAAAAAGTASLFAATSMVGSRMLQNAMPTALANAGSLATIEAAKNVVTRLAPAAPPASTLAAGIKSAALSLIKTSGKAAPVLALAGLAAASVASLMPTPAPAKNDSDGGQADLARQAAARTSASMAIQQTVGATAQSSPILSDGMVDAHTRVVDGKIVSVNGYRR